MTKELLKKILYLALVLIWMLTVFMFSNQNGEKSQGTSRKISAIVAQIFTHNQEINEDEKEVILEKVDHVIRKMAHYSIYAIGGILLYNYIRTLTTKTKKAIVIAILLGIIYAITDELHQYFMNGRSAQITDVIIDSLGIFTGVILMYKIQKNLYNKNSKGEK